MKKENLRESISDIISKILAEPTVRTAFRKMQKFAQENPDVEQNMEELQTLIKNHYKDLEDFCKKYPQSPLCSKSFTSGIK